MSIKPKIEREIKEIDSSIDFYLRPDYIKKYDEGSNLKRLKMEDLQADQCIEYCNLINQKFDVKQPLTDIEKKVAFMKKKLNELEITAKSALDWNNWPRIGKIAILCCINLASAKILWKFKNKQFHSSYMGICSAVMPFVFSAGALIKMFTHN